MRDKIVAMYAFLIAASVGAWALAFAAFATRPLLLGAALIAFGFGLRHAVDADHIAAIDNVTRKLMQRRRAPIGTGFFFSLGHSTVVFVLTLAIALGSHAIRQWLPGLQNAGGVLGTSISAAFLFLVAAINVAVFLDAYRAFGRARRGEAVDEDALTGTVPQGIMARILRPAMSVVSQSWHMYPIGVLFGLGFDTATEVGLLGIAAVQSNSGMPVYDILIFPLLFTVGMSLLDTTDGILMAGAYGWAFVRPVRKLFYNMAITFVSVAVAVLVGIVEVAGVIGDQLHLSGGIWSGLATLNASATAMGVGIVAFFATVWVASVAIYRLRRYDEIRVPS